MKYRLTLTTTFSSEKKLEDVVRFGDEAIMQFLDSLPDDVELQAKEVTTVFRLSKDED